MTLALATGETIRGVAGAGTAITYTLSGDEVSSSGDAFKVLAQGRLPSTIGTLYTVPASTQTIVKAIHLANTTGSTVTAKLTVNGTADANVILPPTSILAGGYAVYGDGRWSAYNDQGQALGVGATGSTGAAGTGVPVGGTAGQRLAKIDSTDYNTEWVSPGAASIDVEEGGSSVVATATALNFDSGAFNITDETGGVAGVALAGGTPLFDQGAFTYLDGTGAAAPGTPASGKARLYVKTDGRFYSKDDAGVEYGPFDAAGGAGGPLLYQDAVALDGTYGDDFPNASLTGWTTGGSPSASVGAATGYDAHTIDLALPAVSDRIYKTYPGDGKYCYLNVPKITQEVGMLALCFIDNSGNGTGVSVYNDGNAYIWVVAANAYSSTGATIATTGGQLMFAQNDARIYRLYRSGTTVTGGFSPDGGVNWYTNSRSDATTFTRVAIIRLFTSGGTGCILNLARFNVV